MEFSSPAQRRLQTLRSHLDSSTADDPASLFLNATASAAPFSNGEHLTRLQLLRLISLVSLCFVYPLRLSFSFSLQRIATALCSQKSWTLEYGMSTGFRYCCYVPLVYNECVCDYNFLLSWCNFSFFLRARSAKSPTKLVSRFPDHPEIGTLHDNFV